MNKQHISVVTGGASGIGIACVRKLLGRGDKVIVLDLGDGQQDELAQNPDVAFYRCDVSDEAQMRDTAASIASRFGEIHSLINSAGIIQRPLPPEELSMQDWDRIVSVDQRGTYLSCLVYGTLMARQGHGAIVNIASITGLRSAPLHAYAPAKAAVISMSQCLAAEWGRSGVRVNSISPGYTLTPALQKEIDAGQRDVTTLAQHTALGRMVHPDEVADAAAFLTSDSSSAITGIDIPVDAGWLVGNGWATYGGVRPARETRGGDNAQD